MNKIDKPIVGYKVLTDKTNKEVTYHPIERSEILTGSTYKIKPMEFAYYITINDITVNGITRPFEIFISTKDAARYPSLLVLTRIISAYFRTGNAYEFIADELKQIIDPNFSYWKQGVYYASFEAELGALLEKHFENLKGKQL